ncbi:MAG: hypothetical protein E7Z87_02660 [Cyanobacteria bacterium SIG26]|nr:hypothetical protein [Cyanobacteria bacterium SIG26]
MGKSKTRILRKGINDQFTRMTREDAINEVAHLLNSNKNTQAHNLITMFGIEAEEALEAGASYEAVIAMKNIFNK